MNAPEVTYPDGEDAMVAYFLDVIEERDWELTVANHIPNDWVSTGTPLLLVSLDGTPSGTHPVQENQTVRLTVYARFTSVAKAFARQVQGAALAHPGGGGVAKVQPLTGLFPARDPDNNAETASVTVRVTVAAQTVA